MGKAVILFIILCIPTSWLPAQQTFRGEWTQGGFVGAGWEGDQGAAKGFFWTDGRDTFTGGFQTGPFYAGVLNWPRPWNLDNSLFYPGIQNSFWDSNLAPSLQTRARTAEKWGGCFVSDLSAVWVAVKEASWNSGLAVGGRPWADTQAQVAISMSRYHGSASSDWHVRPQMPGWKAMASGFWNADFDVFRWSFWTSGWLMEEDGLHGLAATRVVVHPVPILESAASLSCSGEGGKAALSLKVGKDRQAWVKLSGEAFMAGAHLSYGSGLSFGVQRFPGIPTLGFRGRADAAWNPENLSASGEILCFLVGDPFRIEVSSIVKSMDTSGYLLQGKFLCSGSFSGGTVKGSVFLAEGEKPEVRVEVVMRLLPAKIGFNIQADIDEEPELKWELISSWEW